MAFKYLFMLLITCNVFISELTVFYALILLIVFFCNVVYLIIYLFQFIHFLRGLLSTFRTSAPGATTRTGLSY